MRGELRGGGGYFFLKRLSSLAFEAAMRALGSSGMPFLKVKKVQKFAFSRSGMYSAMCSLHWLWADTSQCSQFLQHWRSTPQWGQVSARWSLTSKTSSFLHLWQKCRFCSTLGIQLIAPPSHQALAALHVGHDALVLDLPGARALLHVLELAAHLGLDLVFEGHVLLQEGAHP